MHSCVEKDPAECSPIARDVSKTFLDHLDTVKWNISCYIGGQEMSQPSVILALQMWVRAPKREHNAWDLADAITPTVIAEELVECKKQSFTTFATPSSEQGIKDANNQKQDLAPDSWSTYKRNEFSDLRGLHFLIQRR